jgi:hypothetical protein
MCPAWVGMLSETTITSQSSGSLRTSRRISWSLRFARDVLRSLSCPALQVKHRGESGGSESVSKAHMLSRRVHPYPGSQCPSLQSCFRSYTCVGLTRLAWCRLQIYQSETPARLGDRRVRRKRKGSRTCLARTVAERGLPCVKSGCGDTSHASDFSLRWGLSLMRLSVFTPSTR